MERFLSRVANDLPTRLVVAGLLIVLPVGITSSWISGVFRVYLWGEDFLDVFFGLLVFGGIPIFLSGLVVLYAIERWVIRERALHSWGWSFSRVLLYMAAGVPEGLACMAGIRFGMGRYPSSFEVTYFVQTVVISIVMAVLYTMVERGLAEFRKREAAYQAKIESLNIEINQLRRSQQVKDIVETDFFQSLQEKARGMRRRAEGTT